MSLENPEARQKGFDKTERYLHLLNTLSQQKFDILKFKEVPAKQILRIIKTINTLLNNIPIKENPKSDIQGSQIIDSVEPPSNAQEILIEFIQQMQNNINMENCKTWFVKLYIMIILCHIFPNANGRTGRFLYSKLNNFKTENNIIVERPEEIEKFCDYLNNLGIINLYKKLGIIENSENSYSDDRRSVTRVFYNHYDDSEYGLYGTNTGLKLLALVLNKKDKIKIEKGETFTGNLEIFASEEYKKAFDKVGQLHIQETLNSIDKDTEFFINWLNQILGK